MKILWEWNSFLKAMGLTEKWEQEEDMDAFITELVGHRMNQYWESAEEYGERAWRIAGENYSVIVWDEGNGYFEPLGVEILVDKVKFVKEESLPIFPNPSKR